ncbi:MAG TPA: Gldg family protein [Verrucomicrobiae bacterium]|nr:Gldg family protein [Verrucomicrobiae bacterium]
MKQKRTETLLYSAAGVAVMFLIIIAVNVITSVFKTRIDLTEERLYTLAPGTKAILKKLDSPVEIRFYYSKGETRKPSEFENYARAVEDLLGELRQASGGKIEIKKFDPQPDSEAEDLANLDGVEGQLLQTGEKFYLGLCVSLDPLKSAIPFLAPQQEKSLEYDVVRAIAQVLSTNKPVLGVMTALPVFGQPMNPMMARMGQQGQDPWAFISELKRSFEVKQLNFDVDKIDDDIKVLLVIHPKDVKDTAQYALDQFIMRGGRLIACLDAMCLADANRQNPMMPMPGGPSNLDKLLKAWGVTFETTKVIADMNLARKLRTRQNAPPELMPNLLFLTDKSINKQEVIASQLDELLFAFPGHFTGTPVAGLKQTILLTSSTNAQPVEGFMAQMSPGKIVEDFKGEGKKFTLAMRLEGKFKTAFPEGKPEAKANDAEKKDDKKEDTKPEDKAKDTLKECKENNAVVLIGDTDWLADQFSVQIQNFFGQKIIQQFNGNLSLIQNLVEQMGGDQNLIGVRSRATQSRPFTVVKEMQAQAQARYQEKIASLQKQVDETNQKLSELQGKKEAGQRFVLSREQQEEIERFKAKKAKANQDLKRERRNLRQDIDALENRLKWLNIAGMPVVVAVAGIALGVSRKQKTKAQ